MNAHRLSFGIAGLSTHETSRSRQLSQWRAVGAAIFLSVAVVMISGCGDDGRQAIEGTVSVNGEPLDKGYVRVSAHQNHS